MQQRAACGAGTADCDEVYVDVQALFLKILLHKCHINKYNLVNQVGLIALNCLGEPLGFALRRLGSLAPSFFP